MHVRKLRLLRLKYHISLVELSQASGMTPQRISELELGSGNTLPVTEQKLLNGMEQVIRQRQEAHTALQQDFLQYRDTLMELVGETDYAL